MLTSSLIRGLVSMMRLPNSIMEGFAVVVGEIIAAPYFTGQAALFGYMTGFLLLSAGNIVNDYFDQEIDAINEPNRPMPAGTVSSTQAISFAIILSSLGLLFAAQTGIWTSILALCSLAIMLAYNARLKRRGLLGNVFVSANVAVPFIYGGLVVDRLPLALVIFATLAFVSNVGREVVKGIVDVAGDTVKGIRSVAVKMGNAFAAKFGAALFLVAVALSVLPLGIGIVSNYYVPLVIVCDAGFALTSFSLVTNSTPRNAKRNKKYVLVWMLFGLLAFVVGSL
jgi:geranylgeranylglycerol-phosphate geranylgeranyltransferase